MHILYLTEEQISFSESMVRGGAIHVRNVVEGLRKRGHDVTLIDWNRMPERSFQESIAPHTRFVEGAARTTTRAWSIGRQRDVDVIVSKTRKTYLPGLIAARLLNVPHVVHVGSSLNKSHSDIWDRMDMASFVARLRAPHDGYFVVCRFIEEQLSSRGIDSNKIYNIKNAVDTNRFHPVNVPVPLSDRFRRQINELEDSDLRLGYVGSLHPYKGLDDLVTALTYVDGEYEIIIAGDGPERDRLESAFGERAIFLGSVPYEQVPALYHEFDVLVLPSHTEGLPRVVLEAQATGTVVITTDVGGVPEIVEDGETGFLCPPKTPTTLAKVIDKVARKGSDQKRIAKTGRESVESLFSWETLLDRYESYLESIL
ncbi:glycosyltransferase family 4 protein [Haloterrigena sp. SYSU A121-1]|uniref:Glycosyltransferase family 4 protein n=1 Tax=Haloterrigena gelatinilytica TaxID=2741724 RepID=A0A8J8GRN4_9EURY|nr:glycosyltransferase family 4 protein [Haloterrigena gelatinilytica]NUB93234.1 glycosyltransferase family 4 protein [Haloterrigena gelatinilytica]